MLIGSGVLIRNWVSGSLRADWDVVGALSGGVTIEFEFEIDTPDLDGAHGPVVGTEDVIKCIPKVSGQVIEIARDGLLDQLPGSSYTVDGDYDKITGGDMDSADYLTNLTLAVTHSNDRTLVPGSMFVVKNARGEGLKIDFKPSKKALMDISDTGCRTAATIDTDPYEIWVPTAAFVS